MKVLFVISTASSTRLSCEMIILWCVVWIILVSADRRMTAPQLNSFEWSEHKIGNLIVAGEDITWVIELLDPFPGQVSLSEIVPFNSSMNISMSTSGDEVELAFTVIAAVHICPMMWEVRPKNSVSLDRTESLEMMK